MRLPLLFISSFLFVLQLFVENPIYTYTYDENPADRVGIGDSLNVFFEEAKKHSIEEVLLLPDSLFAPLQNKNEKMEEGTTAWIRFRLVNEGSQTLNSYFTLCHDIDTVSVYTIENSQVIEESKTIQAVNPHNKNLNSISNYVPIRLKSKEDLLYYIKLSVNKPTDKSHIAHMSIYNSKSRINTLILMYNWQFFYGGVMVLFSLVSLFMFGIFRERTFIYFALLTFFFTAYFWHINSVLQNFFIYQFQVNQAATMISITSGLMLSISLFVSDYIQLKKHLPKYYYTYWTYAFFITTVHIAAGFLPDPNTAMVAVNYSVLIWTVLAIIPIVLLAFEKIKPARILLFSIGILFVAGIMQLYVVSFGNKYVQIVRYGFQVSTIVFSGILFYALFDKVNKIRSEKRRFEELDHLKSRFFANISHEFRTPLTLVLGPVKQVMEKQKNEQDKNLLKVAHHQAQRLLQLINQLLDLSKLEAGKMTLKASKQNFTPLVKGIVMSFESLAETKDIRLHFVSQKDTILLYVEQEKIEKILYNLLSNALKFTDEQGEVAVLLTEQDKFVEIQVQDNGMGIPASRLPYIFNRFYQVDSSEIRQHEGTGIGLALVKELVELHKGTIEVQSTIEKGTIFTILLPKGKKHLKKSEIVEDASPTMEEIPHQFAPSILHEETFNIVAPQIPSFNKKRPIVLVVEDHADVRVYIKQYLVQSFEIVEAINGQDGIEKALQYLPDLVISDVMMPKKNGYEVCHTLKTDQRTSHIPIILLTAKAAQEEKLHGLETGADDYLVKPFDTKELEVRVRNLIAVRRQLRKQFAEAPNIEPKAIQTNPVDQAFLEKVCSTIENHLSDEQFGVEVLAEAVGMSRVHLNRKLKALTDLSANKFIRNLRLQKATELLRQKTGNVSEIAFETGFSSTSYFVKCFKDKYGTTPGNFLEG